MRFIIINLTLRSASLISSLLLVLGVTTQLSPDDQGVFYYLQSLAALSFFFDLGIGFVLAHLAGNARHGGGHSRDQSPNWFGVASVARFGSVWLGVAALFYTLVVGSVGASGLTKVAGATSLDLLLWGLFVLGNAGNLILSNSLSFFEGIGFASQTSLPRFLQAFLNSALFFVIVAMDPAPYAIGISMSLSVLVAALFSIAMLRTPIRAIFSIKRPTAILWKKQVLPFQWRIAVSWLTGYFMFQAPTLAIASARKLGDAGRFGLSMQIFLAIISVAQVYLTFGIARWAGHFGNRRPERVYREYLISLAATSAIVVAAGGVFILSAELLLPVGFKARILDRGLLLLLLAGTLGFQLFMCSNFYFRAQLKERLWGISICGGLIMIFGWMRLGDAIDSLSASTLYCAVGLILGLSAILITSFDARRQLKPH